MGFDGRLSRLERATPNRKAIGRFPVRGRPFDLGLVRLIRTILGRIGGEEDPHEAAVIRAFYRGYTAAAPFGSGFVHPGGRAAGERAAAAADRSILRHGLDAYLARRDDDEEHRP